MRIRYWLLLLWVCFVTRGTFYACAIPLWEGFDEFVHYARIEYLATEGREPTGTTRIPEDIAETLKHVPSHNGGMTFDEYWKRTPTERQVAFPAPQAFIYEAQQPPLFYRLFALLYRITAGLSLVSRVIALRIACVLLASTCVPLGFLIARRVLGKTAVALGATALIASMPVLTFTATHVTNDALGIALGTLVVLLALQRREVALALAMGAALLTKAYFLAFLVPIVLLLFYRHKKRAALAFFGALAIGGWWYGRNWMTTRSLTGNMVLVQPSLGDLARSIPKFGWLRAADFSWMTFIWTGNWSFIPIRTWMYHGMALVALLAFAGAVYLVWKRNAEITLLSAFIASFAAAIAYFALGTMTVTGLPLAFGWYACCLVAPIAVVLVAGLRAVMPWPAKVAAVPTLVIAFTALELFGTHVYLLPYYAGFIAHLPNGGLPAFRVAQLADGGFRTLFERLASFGPAWLMPSLLMTLWVLFLLGSITLVAASIYLAREASEPDGSP